MFVIPVCVYVFSPCVRFVCLYFFVKMVFEICISGGG